MLEREETCAQLPRAEVIARLNDQLRKTGEGGTVVMTRGVMSLPRFDPLALTAALASYEGFDLENDPHGERDLGDLALFGADRISKAGYDAAGRPTSLITAFATADAVTELSAAYTTNGQTSYVVDAESNRTTYEYDGHDRLVKTLFPVATKGANASSTSDYEQVGYDLSGNVTSFRTRLGETINLTYDNLGRLTLKDVPTRSGLPTTHTRDVYFGYDLLGDMTYARFDSASGEGITNAFNAIGQLTSTTSNMDSVSRALSYQYDVAGDLTRITHPDGNYIDYVPHPSGALNYAKLNGSSNLFNPVRDSAGRADLINRWNPTAASWSHQTDLGYDAIFRLSSYAYNLAGTTYDTTITFGYNPAAQIASTVRNNDLYAWTGAATDNDSYTANGLNQYTQVGGINFSYDVNGNLTNDGTHTYTYDVENRLVERSSSSSNATLRYDPLGRLYEAVGSDTGTTRFLYDGDELVAEYNGTGTLLRRYVHGGGAGDDPLVWFEGGSVADTARRYLYADERGSIMAVTDSAGTVSAVNTYDEYGLTNASGNDIATRGRFRYTGQAYIPELGMYYYKARMYSPTIGRFMQTDPIGYGDGMNMYAYVGNDPVNWIDPTGLQTLAPPEGGCDPADPDCNGVGTWTSDGSIIVIGSRIDGVTSTGIGGTRGGTSLSGITTTQHRAVGTHLAGARPQDGEIDPCASTLAKIGRGAKVGGDAIMYPGIGLAIIGGVLTAPVGGEGAIPGAAIAEIGAGIGSLGQFAEDTAVGRPATERYGRLAANVLLGRLAVGATRMATGVGHSVLGETLASELLSQELQFWLAPDWCEE